MARQAMNSTTSIQPTPKPAEPAKPTAAAQTERQPAAPAAQPAATKPAEAAKVDPTAASIALAPELRKAAGLLLHERVEIYNVNNGQRFATYVIGSKKKGEVMVNGAAARLVQPGDEVIIAAYADFEPEEAAKYEPTVVLLDKKNRPKLKR